MTKKRPREVKATDTRLIEIYDDLANEDEEIRLKAAHALLSQFSTSTTIEQQKTILKRLFRGLCSGRKAARLGFSVALTEFLSQVFQAYVDEQKIEVVEIIHLLESQTAVEGSTSGQDERDHYFGRLFGAEAIVKSSILFPSDKEAQSRTAEAWERLVEIICGVAKKKPWLREQCGWLFCSCMKSLSKKFNRYVFDALDRHKLLRTPEGVAIWLSQEDVNARKLQSHKFWKHGSPLSNEGVSTLADIMKDAKPQQAQSEDNLDSQGKAMWNPQLHFAWNLVLRELYLNEYEPQVRVSFEIFWLKVVDQGLLAPSSSVERKQWGLLLLAKVFEEAPEGTTLDIMTPNAIACLQSQLKEDSRYLQRSAQKALHAMHARVARETSWGVKVLDSLLEKARAFQFDISTKTKTLEKLVTVTDSWHTYDLLNELYQNPGLGNSQEATHARKIIIDLSVAACMHRLTGDPKLHESGQFPNEESRLAQSQRIMKVLVQIAFLIRPATPEVNLGSRRYAKERIMASLEQALKTKAIGLPLLRSTVAYILEFENQRLQPAYDFDNKIKTIVKDACQRLNSIPGSFSGGRKSGQQTKSAVKFKGNFSSDADGDDVQEDSSRKGTDEAYSNDMINGISLLYHLALLQVYSGEAEAVTIVEDLNAYLDKLADEDESSMESDVLVEVLLTFAAKPSKLLRKINLQAFASFAAQITQQGLESLIRVLETKENLQGQGEMFDAEEPGEEGFDDVNGDASDMEVDSDVEEISAQEGRQSDEDSEPDNGVDGSEEEEDDDEDDQLAAFDAMLAAALGTRKGEDDLAASDTPGSDSDMSDSEMEALDEKLAEVFRARKELTKPKKKEHKDAKENIVNFKNRVLDLVDVYLKQQSTNPLSLQLVLPLLSLARRTTTKQLADRACSILRDFSARCKGANKMPAIPITTPTPTTTDNDAVATALRLFRAIHHEACLDGSNANAHGTACSAASILLVRILSNAGVSAATLWSVYAETGTRMLEDRKCRVQPSFFTDWNNWCASARKTLAK